MKKSRFTDQQIAFALQQAVEQRGGDDRVAEHLTPLGEPTVGGEDHGAAFVASVDQLKEQVAATGDDRQIADLVDDQQREPAEEPQALAQRALALGLGERGDEIGECGEVHAPASLDRLHAQRQRQVVLPVPGGPCRWTASRRSMKSSWASARTRWRSSDG